MAGSTIASLIGLLITFLVFISTYIESQKIVIPVDDIVWVFQQFVPTVAIIVTVIVFLTEQKNVNLRRRRDENQKKVRSCNSILKEIDDHQVALNASKYERILAPNYGIDFTNTYLATHAFESVLQSGSFSQFDSHTQNTLSKLYNRIGLFNKQSDYLDEFNDRSNLSIPTSNHAERGEFIRYIDGRSRNIQQYLTILQREIKELLPVANALIKDEMLKPR